MPLSCVPRSIAPRSSAIRTGGIARSTACARRSSAPSRPAAPRRAHERPAAPTDHHSHRRARRRRRRRAHGLDRQRGRAARLSGAVDLHPRRRPAHRRHHLLHRDRAGAGARDRRAAGAGARAGRRRRRHRAGERAHGSGRTIAGGFVTPDRTLVIASTARSYLVVEKMAMGDGRYDSARLIKAVETQAQSHLLLDMEALAKQSSAMINAVMLGLIAGCRRVPIPAAAFEDAIRADGKAVDANLRGFRSGLDAAARANARPAAHGIANEDRAAADADALAALERAMVMPAAAREVVLAGTRRLAAYQDLAYAQLYVDRLAPIRAADARVGAGGRLVRETARHLAVRMSYEDVIRVAQAKIDPARLPRIAAAMGVSP